MSVYASLVDASTLEVLRHKSFILTPAYVPVLRTLTFPSYGVPEGQRLLLQLQVTEFEESFVVYRLAVPQPGLANVAVNGVQDAGKGPLAFAHVQTGSGLRAAILGEPSGRVRIILALTFSVLAILVHPRIAARLRRAGTYARRLAGSPWSWGDDSPTIFSRALSAPWYPWPTVAVPILHFLASNDIHFAASEAAIPLGVALAVVTGSMVGLRLLLRDWHRPAAATVALTVVLFAYGHAERALHGRVDERVFFAGAVVLGAVALVGAVRAGGSVARGTQFFNLVAGALLVFQAASLAGGTVASLGLGSPANRVSVDDLTAHLFPSGLPTASGERPDIYYIILDAYGRNDALGDFDNTGFLHELETRGFYIASEANSNYIATPHSLASSLNMSYLDDLKERSPVTHGDMINLVYYNALAAILKNIGYAYVHLESGHQFTSKAPFADIFISFRPSGVSVVTNKENISSSIDPIVQRIFLRELIRTTALRPMLQSYFLSDDESTYSWWSPYRALEMFDVLSNPIEVDGPKFVFAHISKPKRPATFDRYGNYVLGTLVQHQFSDSHDPSVPDAYAGQLIFTNALALRMVDAILQNHTDAPPIIVIAGDHGPRFSGRPWHHILAAFHLPSGGDRGLYPSISSVNHFRYVLDVYFDLDIELLEDRTLDYKVTHWDFRTVSERSGE